jgi:hypothetical protein
MKSPLLHLILALIVCVAALAGYWVWYTAISAKSTEVTILQNQIDAKTESVARMATARTALAEIASDEAMVRSYFVPETGVVSFIDNLQARGRSLGAAVSVLSVSTGGTSAQPTLTFALVIKGTFDALMRTIGAIEYAPYAISISNLSIDHELKTSWSANLRLVVGSRAADTATTTP